MATLIIPTAAEIRQIAQDLLPQLMQDRPIFRDFPITEAEELLLIWEQKDNYKGLQNARGIGGAPGRVNPVALNRFMVEPGIYGDFRTLDETTILRRRSYGTFGDQADITDLVLEAQEQLLQRRLNRIENTVFNILQGTYSVLNSVGAVVATDTYTTQTFTSTVPWSTAATATPLLDFRNVKLLHRGHSVSFGAGARAWMNQTTFNRMVMNTNSADLYGRRVTGLATANSLGQVNQLLTGDDLPEIVVYDEFYLTDGPAVTPPGITNPNPTEAFNLFIPNNVVIVIGRRPSGQRVGEYRMTRNAENPNAAPGAYTKVIVHEDVVPMSIDVHDGHNGGPVIMYPSSVVVMTVGTVGA